LLNQLSQTEVNNLNIKNIPFETFSNLSEENLKALLNNSILLNKLTTAQVQMLDPKKLSNFLKDKLSTPLTMDFIKKLSWQQTRQLLNDHTGFRLRNLFTKLKENLPSDALEFMQNKKSDQQQEFKFKINDEKQKNKEKAYIHTKLMQLSEDKRPNNINTAIAYMQDGEALWNSMQEEIWGKKNNEQSKILNEIFKQMDTQPSEDEKQKLTMIFNGSLPQELNSDIFQKFMNSYEKIIIKLQWYFYKKSILEDGRAFDGGAITFKDNKGNLFNFLDNYAKLLNPDYASFFKSWNTKAYKRISSHFKGQTKNKNTGIDIDIPKSNLELGLPLNAPHLLFDQRTNGYVFIKWEPHGMGTIKDIFSHSVSFIKTRGENDESKQSKDRIPEDVKKQFWKLYTVTKTKKIQKIIDSQGISGMLSLLQDNPERLNTFENYLTEKRAQVSGLRNYQKSSLKERRGGESIIHFE
jgi:hypothetical protein